MMKRLVLLNFIVLAIVITGCASKSPLVIWQDNIAEYISKQGNGDPNVLRDTVDMHARKIERPARITFGGLLSDPNNPFSIEVTANGVLLGVKEIESRYWFLFLVGISDNDPLMIEDVRLTGFTSEQDKLLWQSADQDRNVVDQYLSGFPEHDKEIVFPSSVDVYELDVSGHSVIAKENRSGAVWKLDIQNNK